MSIERNHKNVYRGEDRQDEGGSRLRRDSGYREDPGTYLRFTLLCLLAIGSFAILAISVTTMLVGYAEMRGAKLTYQVAFVRGAGGDCDGAHGMYLRVTDGEPVFCQQAPLKGGDVDLPGFTDEQVAEVIQLANQLAAAGPGTGAVGLSAADQRLIQDRVDAILATVPPAEREYGDKSVWGAGRIWTGVGMAVLGVLGLLGVWRIIQSDWI